MGYKLIQELLSTGERQAFFIHRDYHVWFDEYNYSLYIEDNHTPGSLLIQQDTESNIHNSGLLNLIPFELNLTSTPFSNTTVLTYYIDLPSAGKNVGFNSLNYEDFKLIFH